MASMSELDKFVLKFKSLWDSGSNAELIVNTEDGVAHISLHVSVDLGKTCGTASRASHGSDSGRDSPCRKRRRKRREAMRKAKAAEEAASKLTVEVDSIPSSGALQTSEQADMSEFHILVETQKDVRNYEVTEAIEVNFDGCLNDRKIDVEDQVRTIYVHKDIQQDTTTGDMRTCLYKVFVKNHTIALDVIESWKTAGNFDDLAFDNAVSGKKQVKIREIRKIV